MCGIFGYTSSDGFTLEASALQRMGDVISHRGPDDRGVASDRGWAVGNMRLSVIDLENGHQPFVSEDGLVSVVQNGEIFNYIELTKELNTLGIQCKTHSDTEVILRLYLHYGIEFVSRLNGMFAIAIRDERLKATFLVRDRIGVKPLYVGRTKNTLVFGSEIKTILQSGLFDVRPNMQALGHYLRFNYVPQPITLFSGIEHVKPGTWIRITAEGVHTNTWWNLHDIQPDPKLTEADCIEEFNAILDDAVKIRMRCDVAFGAFLSGGVDSSTVVGLMARHSSQAIKTFCIGFEDPKFDESPFAQAASKRFGTEHYCEIVDPNMLDLWPMATWHCDQPHGDVSFLPTYKVSELAAKHTKVVLTGDGGDELFAGYDKHKSFFERANVHQLTDQQFQQQYFDSISLFTEAQKSELIKGSALGSDVEDSHTWSRSIYRGMQHQDRINQALLFDMHYLLSGNNLVKPDRMGMAKSIEARTPFLDYRMMEFAFRVPGHLKLKGGETKYIYKKAVEPLIGRELAYRKKQMFTVPVGEWFKGDLQQYCQQHISGLQTLNADIGLQYLNRHVSGASNHTRELRALIAVAHWEKLFGVVA